MLVKTLVLVAFVAGSLGFPSGSEVGPVDEDGLLGGIIGAINGGISGLLKTEDEEERALDWMKTPFKESKVECHPSANKWECNFEALVIGIKLNGGFAAEFNKETKTVTVKIIMNGNTRLTKMFSYDNLDKICYTQNVPAAGELEVCLLTKVYQKENQDIVACPRVLFYINKKDFNNEEWAELIMNCPTLTANGMSWTRPTAEKDGSDALKDKKYLRFKTHEAVKKGIKFSIEKTWELFNTYVLKK